MNRNDKTLNTTGSNQAELCRYCGHPLMIVWVHGHGQCNFCKVNIDECCRGESCETNFKDNNLNQTKK